ncbi:DUF4255 domain-containing protein [Teredinibacter turnerae]|uniref:DUF4255 domain-containing protein n=1 Tax=Teredinibacter turnerae TaxID=2426 RepID=UPI00035C49C6|nr:DUF4255 domain-containing protein [Teredinibacter turnerae]
MLDKALNLIATRLNAYILNRVDLDEDIVQLASPVSPDGVSPIEANDKILIFLANIAKDTLAHSTRYKTIEAGSLRVEEPLHLNFYLFVAANFHASRYGEALTFLSYAIQHFHENRVIDRRTVADLPPGLDRLIVDIQNTDINESTNLWGVLGGKYLPSVFYKVRLITLRSESVVSRINPASAPEPTFGQ